MATPNYEQIQSFGLVRTQLVEAAVDELMDYLYDGISRDEVVAIAAEIAGKYAMLGEELGAQWYDLCTELAGIQAEPAVVAPVNDKRMAAWADSYIAAEFITKEIALNYLQDVINDSIRSTGDANLWRDYERGLAGGKWCRVPVGDTCAWCMMLASNGAWYLSEESAKRTADGDKYHDHCDCIAVYHADAENIRGYTKLYTYKKKYYDAENARQANDTGRTPYPDELKYRISQAEKEHKQREERRYLEALERGEEYEKKPWTVYNEDMIVMRWQNPGLH